jgi:hypothetical protein
MDYALVLVMSDVVYVPHLVGLCTWAKDEECGYLDGGCMLWEKGYSHRQSSREGSQELMYLSIMDYVQMTWT